MQYRHSGYQFRSGEPDARSASFSSDYSAKFAHESHIIDSGECGPSRQYSGGERLE